MTTQLKLKGLNNGHYKYNADGIIKDNQSDLEILLTEVSSAFGSNEVGKISFDHYKAMFGQLSMLRTVAHIYEYASFNTFKKLKVHFLHGHGTAIRHWSMSVQSPGIFVMNKEQKVEVPVKFAQKDLYLLEFIEFYKSLALALEDTTEILTQLKQEHKEVKSSNTNCKSLLGSIDPVIIRLNEGKHLGIVADEGPMSVPPSPDRDQKN
ncbi:hypothetical protein BDB00DRAFT_771874 [Zychaea mexicana]|uniref:uncharacterized protein n=1 Tax=Zychaea mexicana TaxID=64656 RepID=UPI0022FF1D65|nr:uncharacterized protein BDB00DRAFT_771839 [Zychaea mexicana]XP_052975056.1 uncharacterized protein BDB00DRAFT_771874 [Zychaea mexicana]KAI9488790.1 hypothetical protein BDB00DRAFT_771839 [Zychaea mexicana]KAI9488791.1 hypothetical protein BDB00DRAFT_771874 [Zychaea mexicana]